MKSTGIFAKIGAATVALLMAMSIIGCPQTNNGNDYNGDIVNEVTVITRDGVTFSIPAGLRQEQVDAISAIVNALDVAEFSGYVTNVSFASVGTWSVQLVGEGTETMATITLPLNATAEQIAKAFGEAQEFVQDARQVDENYIGTAFGIRVTVAEGVEREHGEHALDRLEAFDTNAAQGFPYGGRVAHVAGEDIIKELVITGAPEESFSVRHIGNGVLEVRLASTPAGQILSILTDGRWQIENDVIHAFILDMQKDRGGARVSVMKNP